MDETKQTNNNQDNFLDTLSSSLLKQSGIISSNTRNIDSAMNEAITGVKSATESETKRIESAYGRERDFATGQADVAFQEFNEGRTGFATQMTGLRQLVETTDKNLKDLEQRKQELILQNNSAGASKVAELQFAQLKFKQEAEQQVFSNLLGMAGFGVQKEQLNLAKSQEERLTKAQTWTEKSTMVGLASQYGVTLNDNDTLETLSAKIAPFASAKQQAELAKTLAETRRLNAEVARIQSEGATTTTTDEDLIEAGFIDKAVLASIKDFNQLLRVVQGIDKKKGQAFKASVLNAVSNGTITDKKSLNDYFSNNVTGYEMSADTILKTQKEVEASFNKYQETKKQVQKEINQINKDKNKDVLLTGLPTVNQNATMKDLKGLNLRSLFGL